ncbi:MAG TPA: ABC transporter permease [Pyrinomonadaceae bacterium]
MNDETRNAAIDGGGSFVGRHRVLVADALIAVVAIISVWMLVRTDRSDIAIALAFDAIFLFALVGLISLQTSRSESLGASAWRRLLKNRLAVVGLVIVALMFLTVINGPVLLDYLLGLRPDYIPAQGDLINSFPPSWQHLLGTDEAGRDLLARVLQGGRISLMVGIISTVVSLAVGVTYGAVAGYLGGAIDNVMMRIVDIIYAIPYILIVIVLLKVFGGSNTASLVATLPAIVAGLVVIVIGVPVAVALYRGAVEFLQMRLFGYTLWLAKFVLGLAEAIILAAIIRSAFVNIGSMSLGGWLSDKYTASFDQSLSQIFLLFFALGLVSWLTMARVVRGQILSLKNQEFVLAARATGVSAIGIIFKHLIPNALGPVVVYATLTIPSVMLTEAFLSFLGLGVQAPYASWGSLASDGIKNIAIFPWQLIAPAVTMALTLFSLNFLGDGIRDALDPQTRKF